MQSFPFKRIVVVGATSSGKSTLAKRLADQFNLDFIELDALHWEPNWIKAPLDVFRARVDQATHAECWAAAGNYHTARDIIWPRAQAIIWLDYSLWTIFWQLTRRTFTRWWTRELLWGTNRENLLIHFKLWSDDSLYRWLFKTYWRRKREYPMLFAQPENAHLKIIQLKSPKETEEWVGRFLMNSNRQSASSAEPGNDLCDSQSGNNG
jgi:adenylate kinase family enzyme